MDRYLENELSTKNTKYDTHAKRLLRDKNILASIMTEVVPEFKGYTLEEAKNAIEGKPKVGSVPVRPTDAIRGISNESSIPGEGTLTFDVVFTAVTKTHDETKVYINLEAQSDFHPGYDLITRGVVYGARLISEQMDTEFTPENYDDAKKVYSIWIFMQAPIKNQLDEKVSDSIFKYSLKPSILYKSEGSNVNPERWRYDLLTVIAVCLGKDTFNSKNKVIGLLSTVFSDKMLADEKTKRLKEEYQFPIGKRFQKEVNIMCNISQALHSDLKDEIKELKQKVTNAETEIANAQRESAMKDAQIEELKRQLAEALNAAK